MKTLETVAPRTLETEERLLAWEQGVLDKAGVELDIREWRTISQMGRDVLPIREALAAGRVYGWHSRHLGPRFERRYSFLEAGRLLGDVFRHYGLPEPDLRPAPVLKAPGGEDYRYGRWLDREWRIEITPEIMHLDLLLHEAAHGIAGHLTGRGAVLEGHGPVFVRVLVDLLKRHAHYPVARALEELRSLGLKVAPARLVRELEQERRKVA